MECLSSPNTKWATTSSQLIHPREIDGRDPSYFDPRRSHYHSVMPPLVSASSSYESRRNSNYESQSSYVTREPHYMMERYVTRYPMGYRHPPSSYYPFEAHPFPSVPPQPYGGGDVVRRPYPTEPRHEPYQQHYVPHTPCHEFRPPPPPPVASSSETFAPLKSPISHCIDVIIGAAEIVNRNDAMEKERRNAYRDFEAEQTDSIQKPKEIRDLPVPEAEYSSPDEEIQAIEAKLEDGDLLRNLTLTMALERPRKADKPIKPPPNIIGEGFYWKEYPELEDVLYSEMKQYYEYSANSRQSKHQQAYNNGLVENIKNVATIHGYIFDPDIYNDKKLRDRIRCFYKTHLQNAKKRLQTLQKHISGPDQRRQLREFIQSAQEQPLTTVTSWTSSLLDPENDHHDNDDDDHEELHPNESNKNDQEDDDENDQVRVVTTSTTSQETNNDNSSTNSSKRRTFFGAIRRDSNDNHCTSSETSRKRRRTESMSQELETI